jgi:predicted secreted protein
MTALGKWAYGTVLTVAGNPIAELSDIGWTGEKADTIDVTTHDSANGFKEFIGALRDGGELTIKGNWYPGDTNGQMILNTHFLVHTVGAYVLTFPAAMAATMTCSAFVTAWDPNPGAVAGKVDFTATMKITGKPTIGVTLSAGANPLAGIEENAGAALLFDPTFAIGTFAYGTLVNTASTWIKLTVTAAAHTITITTPDLNSLSQNVASGVQSAAITLGAADTLTRVVVTVQEVNKVAKTYTFWVSRP